MANHQCQGMSNLTSTTLPATKDNHADKPQTDARTRRHRAMAIPPLRTEMARTVLHGSSRQQHHNVNASVFQPSGDPDGLRRHALSVKETPVTRLFTTSRGRCLFTFLQTSFDFFLIWRRKIPISAFFFLWSLLFNDTHIRSRTSHLHFWEERAWLVGWDGIGLALGNALDGEKRYRSWNWEAMGDFGAGSGWRQPSGDQGIFNLACT